MQNPVLKVFKHPSVTECILSSIYVVGPLPSLKRSDSSLWCRCAGDKVIALRKICSKQRVLRIKYFREGSHCSATISEDFPEGGDQRAVIVNSCIWLRPPAYLFAFLSIPGSEQAECLLLRPILL